MTGVVGNRDAAVDNGGSKRVLIGGSRAPTETCYAIEMAK